MELASATMFKRDGAGSLTKSATVTKRLDAGSKRSGSGRIAGYRSAFANLANAVHESHFEAALCILP